MDAKVKEIAREDAERVKVLAQDAVRSGAYIYPIKVTMLLLTNGSRLLIYSPGTLLLHISSLVMETSILEASTNSNYGCWRNDVYVRFRIPSPSRRPSDIQWPVGGSHNNSVGFERKFYHLELDQ